MVEIFNPDGEVSEYLPVAERIASFLEEYGPQTGYGVCTRTYNTIGNPSCIVFEVKLIDPEDRVVAQASALRFIDGSDACIAARLWESGETAALQRLMARVGYGSEQMLADEMGDMTARGTEFSAAATLPSPEADENDEADEADEADTADAADSAEDDSVSEQAEDAPVVTDKVMPEVAKGTAGSSEVPEAVLRQIRHLAAARGIDPPVVTTKAEARKALKQLRDTPAD